MKQLLREIYRENKWIFYFTLFVALFSGIANIWWPVIQKYVVDSIVDFESFERIVYLIIIFFFVYAFTQLFGALTYYFSKKIWESVLTYYKQKSIEKFNRIKFNIIVDKKEGEINEIISKWTKALSETINNFFGSILQNGFIIFFGLIVLFTVNIYIFLYFLFIFIPLFVFYSLKEIKRIIPASKKLNQKENKVSGSIIEYLSNIRDIKLLWAENNFTRSFFRSFGSLFDTGMNIEKRHHFMNFKQFLILTWSICLILLYTSYNIVLWVLSVWTFLLVYSIFLHIRYALWAMVFLYRNFEENIIKINKLLGFFELEETVNIKPQKIKLFESLQIKNLEFKYGENQEILKSINFSIQSGQKIAIIWKSGAGKTTLINIILWLYEWYKWEILLNEKSISGNIESLFSYVPQDVQVFNENLKFNLTLWGKFKDSDLIDMLKKVWLSYLSKRAKKWKTILDIMVGSDGLKLSGWERQRLGIARAMIRDKDIYVFDEITSNLDEETEKDIIDLIFSIAKKKTFIIISHKKEILKKVDRIYEMKNGKLI